jgi:hypothetical protein
VPPKPNWGGLVIGRDNAGNSIMFNGGFKGGKPYGNMGIRLSVDWSH